LFAPTCVGIVQPLDGDQGLAIAFASSGKWTRTIRNQVVADHETAHTWSQVFIPATTDERLACEQCESRGDRIDHAVGDVDAAALGCENGATWRKWPSINRKRVAQAFVQSIRSASAG
jgi:hypothetical protein